MRHRTKIALVAAATLATGVLPAVAGDPARGRISAGSGYASGDDVRNGAPIHGMIVADANEPILQNVADLPRLAEDGVNQASFYVTKYFDDLYHPTISDGPFTPTANEILTAVDAAHSAGMTVQLDPILWSSGTYRWRGAMDPGNMDTFWPSYRAMILDYAELAQTADVEVFAIGSELRGMEKYTARWRALAHDVRSVYHGQLIYMGVTQSLLAARFWDAVDYIAISPYFSLSSAPVPSYRTLLNVWKNRFFPALAKISAYWQKPLLFNETGYLSQEGTTARPSEWRKAGAVSQTVQANAYAALLDAAKSAPWLKGIVFFRWSPPTSGPLDHSYSPRDKQSECVMAKRWSSPSSIRLADGSPLGCLGSQTTGAVLAS